MSDQNHFQALVDFESDNVLSLEEGVNDEVLQDTPQTQSGETGWETISTPWIRMIPMSRRSSRTVTGEGKCPLG
jgi:hypothetical protein